ncbi:hypothetical protein BC628DRAFT_1423766 [Trametes gibbosa]|nr:hypothetical protein BC628DRAFT_1423766 [Trametes gibbosa]
MQHPKQQIIQQAALTHKSVTDLPAPADHGQSVRKRAGSSTAATSLKSKKIKRTAHVPSDIVTQTLPPSTGMIEVQPGSPSVQALANMVSAPPRARRKVRPAAIDYEKVLTAPVPFGTIPSCVDPAPSVVKPPAQAAKAISGVNKEVVVDEGDSDEEDEQSGEEPSVEDDNEDASESEDDLLDRAPVRLEADLAAERPIWCKSDHTQVKQGKGKERAATEDALNGESEVEEDKPAGSESEYECPMSSDEQGLDVVEDTEAVVRSTAGPSSGELRVVNKNKVKGTTKREVKQALEQPTWKTAQAIPSGQTTSTSALTQHSELQIWTMVPAHASTGPTAAPLVDTIPPPLAIIPPPAAIVLDTEVVAAPPPAGPALSEESDDEAVRL